MKPRLAAETVIEMDNRGPTARAVAAVAAAGGRTAAMAEPAGRSDKWLRVH